MACNALLRLSPVSPILQLSTYDAQYLPLEVLQRPDWQPGWRQLCSGLHAVGNAGWKEPLCGRQPGRDRAKTSAPLVEPLFPPENAPWQISRVLEQALSPEPQARFENASELVAALKHATSPGGVDRTELARREAQVEAWRASEQQARLQAEETARLAALEQARREIQEQARREVEALGVLEAETPVETASDASAPPGSARRRARRRPARPRSWPLLALAAILLVALASYWLDQRLSAGELAQPTPTATTLIQPAAAGTDPGSTSAASSVTSAAASNTASRAFTATASLRPSATPTRTSTATKKPTLTPSSTPQPSPTLIPSRTFTPVKPEKPERQP